LSKALRILNSLALSFIISSLVNFITCKRKPKSFKLDESECGFYLNIIESNNKSMMGKLYFQFKALTTQDDFKFYLNSFILGLGLKAMEDIKNRN
jgi:hypothetical protein